MKRKMQVYRRQQRVVRARRWVDYRLREGTERLLYWTNPHCANFTCDMWLGLRRRK